MKIFSSPQAVLPVGVSEEETSIKPEAGYDCLKRVNAPTAAEAAPGCGFTHEAGLSALAGPLLFKYGCSEKLLLKLADCVPNGISRYVACWVGPLLGDGTILKEFSIKVAGNWAETPKPLQWVLPAVPLQSMAQKSPLGIVACTCEFWDHRRVYRRWLGSTQSWTVPAAGIRLTVGNSNFFLTVVRGIAADMAVETEHSIIVEQAVSIGSESTRVGSYPSTKSSLSSLGVERSTGEEILNAVTDRQWGIAAALVKELRLEPEESRRNILSESDGARRTAFRLCIDATSRASADKIPLLRALQDAKLMVVMCTKKPYWWSLHILSTSPNGRSFTGEVRIGMPLSRSGPSKNMPAWHDCCWSEAHVLSGSLWEVTPAAGDIFAHLHAGEAGEAVNLQLRFVDPGAPIPFGVAASFPNPLGFQMLAAEGTIVGSDAKGAFDVLTCARLACEQNDCGPRDVAILAVAAGADPRALSDDGMSPFTASLLAGRDPCGLLKALNPLLRDRMKAGDSDAWAQAARAEVQEVGRFGQARDSKGNRMSEVVDLGLAADLVAAPLRKGYPVPRDLAQALLARCLSVGLPLLAARVLTRVDGQANMLAVMERAGDPHWYRVAQKILQQKSVTMPAWCSCETLAEAVRNVQNGLGHYRLLMEACLSRLWGGMGKFWSSPSNLPDTGAGVECPICFEPLCSSVAVAFVGENRRAVCSHFVCSACARGYEASAYSSEWRRCPECRRSATSVAPLPKLDGDALARFEFLQGDETTVPLSTLIRSICASLPLESEDFAKAIEERSIIQSPLSQNVSATDFLTSGLYAWAWRHEIEYEASRSRGPPPRLTEASEWFRYWNISGSGSLCKAEVLRALMYSFEVASLDFERVQRTRQKLNNVWQSHMARISSPSNAGQNGFTESQCVCEGGFCEALEDAFSFSLNMKVAARQESRIDPVTFTDNDLCEGAPPAWAPHWATASGPPPMRRCQLIATIAANIVSSSIGPLRASGCYNMERPSGVPYHRQVGVRSFGNGGSSTAATDLRGDEPAAGVLPMMDAQDEGEERSGGSTHFSPLGETAALFSQEHLYDGSLQGVNLSPMEALEYLERDLHDAARPERAYMIRL